MTAIGFRSSALEDLRPSQEGISGRPGLCEKLTSLGGRENDKNLETHGFRRESKKMVTMAAELS